MGRGGQGIGGPACRAVGRCCQFSAVRRKARQRWSICARRISGGHAPYTLKQTGTGLKPEVHRCSWAELAATHQPLPGAELARPVPPRGFCVLLCWQASRRLDWSEVSALDRLLMTPGQIREKYVKRRCELIDKSKKGGD